MSASNIIAEKRAAMLETCMVGQPLTIVASITISEEQMKQAIQAGPTGKVFRLRDLIDDCDALEAQLRQRIGFYYSLNPEDKEKKQDLVEVNFLVAAASIEKPVDLARTTIMAGFSLAMNTMRNAQFPFDAVTPDGKFRKLIDIAAPLHFLQGKPCAALHHFVHEDREPMVLLGRKSQLNPTLIAGDTGESIGTGGMFYDQFDGQCAPLLHGVYVNDGNAYPGGQEHHEGRVEILTNADSELQCQKVVGTRNGAYTNTWFHKDPKYLKEHGCAVPMTEYGYTMFDFVDRMNASRCVNFDVAGIWVQLHSADEPAGIVAQLRLEILPIVPKYEGDVGEILTRNYTEYYVPKNIAITSQLFAN